MNLKPFVPAFACLAAITYLSTSPKAPLPEIHFWSADKVGHLLMYALLAGLCLWGVHNANNRRATRLEQAVIFGVASGYGAFMEWVQSTFFPGRFFEYGDMLANTAGAFLAILAYRIMR